MKYCIYCMKKIDDTQNICPYCHKDNEGYITDAHVLPAGTLLNEKYLVGAVLGEGGFGITYIGRNLLLNITVAIKEFYPTGMVTRNSTQAYTITSISEEKAQKLFSESKDIFWKEAKTLAGFNAEPGIVSVLDFFTANNTAYIVTEFLEGETLGKYLDRMGKIPFDNALCLLMPVMESLIKIHKKNLIHRDISPDNIMLVGESVKLIDFGATRQYADNHSLSVILKEGYAPVEQYSSKGHQGTWTDVYALCAVIYRCITGIVPVAASERMSADEEIQLPSELGIDLRPEVEQILMKGLALKRKDRIQTVEELIEEFTKVMNSKVEETQPTEDGIPENPESVTEQPDAVSSDNNSDESVDTLIVLPVSNMEDGETTEPENTPLPNNDNADNRLTGLINSPVAFSVSDDETETEDNHPEPETNSSQTNDNSDTNKRLTVLIDTPRDLDLSNEEESTKHTTEPVSAPEPENTPEEVSKVKYWVAAIVSVLLIGGGIFGVSRLNSGGGLQVDYSEVTESATTAATTTAGSVTESSSLTSSSSATTTDGTDSISEKETIISEITLEKEVELPEDFKPKKFKYELVIDDKSVSHMTVYDTTSPIKVKSNGTTGVERVEIYINEVLYVSYDFDFGNNSITLTSGPNTDDIIDSLKAEEVLSKKDEVNDEVVDLVSGWLIKRSQNLAVEDGILLMNTNMLGTSLENVCNSIGLKKLSMSDLEDNTQYDKNDKMLTVRFKDNDSPVYLIFRNGKLRRVEYNSESGAKMKDLDKSLFATRKNKLINKLGAPQFSETFLNRDDPKRAVEWNNELYICRLSLRPIDSNTGFIEQYFQEPDLYHKYFKVTNSFLSDNCIELIGKSKSEILKKFDCSEDEVYSSVFSDSGDSFEFVAFFFTDNEYLNVVIVGGKVFQIEYYTTIEKYNSILSAANSKGWNLFDHDDKNSVFNIGNSMYFWITKEDGEVCQRYFLS